MGSTFFLWTQIIKEMKVSVSVPQNSPFGFQHYNTIFRGRTFEFPYHFPRGFSDPRFGPLKSSYPNKIIVYIYHCFKWRKLRTADCNPNPSTIYGAHVVNWLIIIYQHIKVSFIWYDFKDYMHFNMVILFDQRWSPCNNLTNNAPF